MRDSFEDWFRFFTGRTVEVFLAQGGSNLTLSAYRGYYNAENERANK